MLAAYAHPSCAGVLLRGRAASSLAVARSWLATLGVDAARLDGLLEKLTEVKPAQHAADRVRVRAKWAGQGPLRVLFCGRDFHAKNGLLALEVMARICSRVPGVEFVYVGSIPEWVPTARPELMQRIRFHPALSHEASLEEMQSAHILFHPSRGESIGIVLLEAMGAGMAVVTSRGEGMGYSDELFASGGALLLDRTEVCEKDEAALFEHMLLQVLGDRTMAAGMAARNHELTDHGEFSIAEQNRALAAAYSLALTRQPGPPLRLSDVPHSAGQPLLQLSSREVAEYQRRSRERQGLEPGYLAVVV
jgi:glycosyltransferase involved in cell wall biosynthesis